ncbi:MAG: hypothetical protein JWN16_1154 [Alphaproteobacteria bacterium]|nr:hypothetical protein [Alphaproteobacteria bacterium]
MLSKRILALFVAPLMLGGCTTMQSLGGHIGSAVGLDDDAPKSYTASAVSEPTRAGIAVSDEPLAARAGASALASSGSAVDAVTAMFFTLSATYPVAAGLGAGGICLVRDAGGQVSEYDFLTRTPARGGAYAVPGAVRGFADMQRDHGMLPWQRVVAPGEAYAATGFPISQALAVRLAGAQNQVRLDADLAAEFLDESGQARAAGTEVKNAALAQTLAEIRLNGADGFYRGLVAARIESWSTAQGGAVDLNELAAVRSTSGAARSRGTGEFITWLPGARTGAGVFTASLLDNLSHSRGSDVAGAVRQSLTSFGVTALPHDLGSTGFAAVDASGQAASCAVTLNGPFGAGRTAAGTGVQLAASPVGQSGLASAFLAPLIATNSDGVAIAAAGAGGPNGTAAAVTAVLEAAGGRKLGRRGDLRGTGAAPFDTVNVIACDTTSCVGLSDPGAHGAGAAAEVASNP